MDTLQEAMRWEVAGQLGGKDVPGRACGRGLKQARNGPDATPSPDVTVHRDPPAPIAQSPLTTHYPRRTTPATHPHRLGVLHCAHTHGGGRGTVRVILPDLPPVHTTWMFHRPSVRASTNSGRPRTGASWGKSSQGRDGSPLSDLTVTHVMQLCGSFPNHRREIMCTHNA